MSSCKWHRFFTNCKIQNGCHRTSAIHIFVIFVYHFFVWSPWYKEIYSKCIVLMIWDMTTINGTRYVIVRSGVRAPPGVWYLKKFKRVINIHYDEATIFDSHGNFLVGNLVTGIWIKSRMLGSTKRSSIDCLKEIAIFCARIYEKVMRPNILALHRAILQKPLLFYVILKVYWYYCRTVDRYTIHYFVLEYQQSKYKKRRQVSSENYWCMHVSLDFLYLQEAVHGLGFHPHHAMIQLIIQVHVVNIRQTYRRGDNNESLGTKQLS